jgi:conjugal transfer ATP-binding protein TraC
MADVMPDVGKKLDDWTAAANAIDTGGSLVSLYHQLAIFSHPRQAASAHEAANAIWRGRGFQLNADAYMHRQALLASLPMTLTPSASTRTWPRCAASRARPWPTPSTWRR